MSILKKTPFFTVVNIHTQIKYGLKKSKCKNEHNGIIKKIKLE